MAGAILTIFAILLVGVLFGAAIIWAIVNVSPPYRRKVQ